MVVKPDDSGYRKIVQTFVRKVCGARSEKHQFYAFRIFSFTSWNRQTRYTLLCGQLLGTAAYYLLFFKHLPNKSMRQI